MIKIRSLKNNDKLDDLIALSRKFFQEYEVYHQDFFSIHDLKDEHIINYFSSFCGHDTRKAFIAVDGHRMVGYITIYIDERAVYWQISKTGEISGLMVQKDYRRSGIAKELLKQAKVFFTHKQVDYYNAFTAVANQGAVEFYRKSGMLPLYTTLIGDLHGIPDQ